MVIMMCNGSGENGDSGDDGDDDEGDWDDDGDNYWVDNDGRDINREK